MPDDTVELQRVSQIGETLEDFLHSRHWDVFKAEVLDVLYQKAFKEFITADPSDTLQIMQVQQGGKVIKNIETMVEGLINAGRLARHHLANLPQEEE